PRLPAADGLRLRVATASLARPPRRARARLMENVYTAELKDEGDYSRARVGERAGATHLGLTVYELAPGQGMHFHYHLQREELLSALQPRGRGLWLRRRRAAALTRLAESAWLLVRHVGSLPVVAELGDQRLEQLQREEPDDRVRSGVGALAGARLLEQVVEQ